MKRKKKKDERDAAKHSYNEDDDVDFFDDHATSFRIKNSWGDDFADKGYFRVEADAFPKGFDQYYEVVFYVSDLPTKDVQNYKLHNDQKGRVLADNQGLSNVIARSLPDPNVLLRANDMFEECADACVPFITFMKTKIKSGRCKCLVEVICEVCYQFEEL